MMDHHHWEARFYHGGSPNDSFMWFSSSELKELFSVLLLLSWYLFLHRFVIGRMLLSYYTSDACTLCGVSKSSYSTNDVNLKKETLRIQPDEENPGKYLIAFDFDATVPGR
ncbi:hypothetical protein T459_25703 [Capsicum annuum]|uniref:MGRN1/RNF157-like N-terminal domain-containing protein n=1 Tax=Capsicum annuum TaxID=4072 RepID=A0A2G2YLI4_CAPAN|nr:hypothetical protein T459_25703 [Capsicum annuum]